MARLLRFATTVLLTGSLAAPYLVPAAAVAAPRSGDHSQQRALHLLDRMTFGPTPGQAQAVARMGVYQWFDQQLHPARIDNSALDVRLEEYPAIELPPQVLFAQYPSQNQLRQAIAGKVNPPAAQPMNAVWQSGIERLEQKRDRKEAASAAPAAASATGASASMLASSAPAAAAAPAQPAPNLEPLLQLSPDARYHALLALQPGTLQAGVRALPGRQHFQLIAGLTPAQRDTVLAMVNPRLVVVNEEESARLLRDVYSQRQVEQVMTEFWLNHFNIATEKNDREPYYLAQFANETIAPHALGRFEDLLDAVAQSPAMLIYLDNVQSIGPDSQAEQHRRQALANNPDLAKKNGKGDSGINENYGRELMELHTVGVNGGYTQQDVIEAAKVLTGWTVAPPEQGGGFRFNERTHEPGDKTVLGHVIQQGGQQEGLDLLHVLATSPATARMLSTQLAVRFVGDTPPPALLRRMEATYMKSDGNISAVLETMVHSPEFWSVADTGNKVKTPLDYVASALRATDANVTEPYRLVSELKVMGMPLSGTQEPNGYPMTNTAWSSASELVERMNFALALTANRIPGVTVDLQQLPDQQEAGTQEEPALEQALLGEPANPQVHDAVLQGMQDTPAQAQAASRLVLAGYNPGTPFARGAQPGQPQGADAQLALEAALLLGSPQFQRR